MNKNLKISRYITVCTLLFSSVVLNAADLNDIIHNKTISHTFFSGDTIEVDHCNKYQWCKVKDADAYIRRFNYHKLKNENILTPKKNKAPTSLFVKDKQLPSELKKQFLEDFDNGYISVIKLESVLFPVHVQEKEEPTVVKTPHITKSIPVKEQLYKPVAEKKKVETKQVKNNPIPMTHNSSWFIEGSLGMFFAKINSNVTIPLKSQSLDDNGILIDIGAGYRYNRNIFSTISLQRSMLENINIDNLYTSLNYTLDNISFNPYVGLLLGYSQLEWQKSPVNNPTTAQADSQKILYGLQIGAEYELNKSFSLIGKYQFMYENHMTNINSQRIKHLYQNNLLFGLRYSIYTK